MDAEKAIDGHEFAQSAPASPAAAGLVVDDAHAAGRITLSDAAAGNVPDLAGLEAVLAALPRWGRSPITYCVTLRSTLPGTFAAGYGPVLSPEHAAAAREWFRNSYALTWALDCFTKPFVSFIDGAVSGAGIGLSLYGTHRVGGRGYRLSVPGPTAGWFPDHGLAHVLSRLPDRLGVYLALTGHAIGRADAFRLGLITQCIDAGRFDHIAGCLSEADPVDPLLDDLHEDAGAGELEARREIIARCFSAASVGDIAARLGAVTGAHAAWAQGVAAELRGAPALALAVTLRLLREARDLDLRDTLVLDDRIATRLLAGRRAAGGVSEAGEAAVARCFDPLEDGDLPLLSRAEMQKAGP
ncbi:MAG: enoyl-CoA hydratase/isomerase family protein [Hyphomicrobiaceae bacterium]|nr:enoyl-CoA hydratase/isomerase family protein [Hyphomicrobiaceae bacterium]